MIVHTVPQGSPEWTRLRLGKPTASQFDRIFTPHKRKPSRGQARYRDELLEEWLTGRPTERFSNGWMDHGREQEPRARMFYELEAGCSVVLPGFITRDDGLVGGTPDGFVGDDTVLEIKCPKSAADHTDRDHVGQCQGYLYLCERPRLDLYIYGPGTSSALYHIARDEEYLAAMVPVLDQFVGELEDEKRRLTRLLAKIGTRPAMATEDAYV